MLNNKIVQEAISFGFTCDENFPPSYSVFNVTEKMEANAAHRPRRGEGPTHHLIGGVQPIDVFDELGIKYFETINVARGNHMLPIDYVLKECIKRGIRSPKLTRPMGLMTCLEGGQEKLIKFNEQPSGQQQAKLDGLLAEITTPLYLIKDKFYLANEFNGMYDFIFHKVAGVVIYEALESI